MLVVVSIWAFTMCSEGRVDGVGYALLNASYDTIVPLFWKPTADGDFPVQKAGIRAEVVQH